MKITQQLIESGKSGNGGWSRAQLELIGVPWPPAKGWRERVCGDEIPDEAAARFVAIRKQPKPITAKFVLEYHDKPNTQEAQFAARMQKVVNEFQDQIEAEVMRRLMEPILYGTITTPAQSPEDYANDVFSKNQKEFLEL